LFKSLAIAFCRIRWVHRIDSCSSVCLSLSNKSLVRSLGNSLSFRLARASRSFFCSLFRCATHYTSFLACPSAPRTLPRLPDSTSLSQTRFPWVDLFCTLPELTLYTAPEVPTWGIWSYSKFQYRRTHHFFLNMSIPVHLLQNGVVTSFLQRIHEPPESDADILQCEGQPACNNCFRIHQCRIRIKGQYL